MAGAPDKSPEKGTAPAGMSSEQTMRGWRGRPRVDVPGLDEPAYYCHAIADLGEIGHRAVLVIATEDGSMPTTKQLTALQDGLDELHGDEAPEGSRAWLRTQRAELADKVRQLTSGRDAARRRAEQVEAALRERSDVTDQAARIEQLTFELQRTKDAHAAQAARAAQLYQEREQLAREVTELASNGSRQRQTIRRLQREVQATEEERDEARAHLTEAGQALRELQPLAEANVLRTEVEDQTRRAENAETALARARSDWEQRAHRGQAQVDRLVETNSELRGRLAEASDERGRLQAKARLHGDEVMGLRDQLRGHEAITAQVESLYGELDDAFALADETRDALIESVKHAARADHGERNARREAATQAARARTAVGGAVGALLTAATAAALAWRPRR